MCWILSGITLRKEKKKEGGGVAVAEGFLLKDWREGKNHTCPAADGLHCCSPFSQEPA